MDNLITLSRDGVTLVLPEDLRWTDEFDWSPVAQSTERSICGVLIVDEIALIDGRPITLAGGGDSAWILRETLRQIHAWSAIPGAEFTLFHNGQTYTVFFGRSEGELEATPLVEYADPIDSDDYCSLKLRFLTKANL